jgi:hypothetical protein
VVQKLRVLKAKLAGGHIGSRVDPFWYLRGSIVKFDPPRGLRHC